MKLGNCIYIEAYDRHAIVREIHSTDERNRGFPYKFKGHAHTLKAGGDQVDVVADVGVAAVVIRDTRR